MKPPNMVFIGQIDPSIKSYEHVKFLRYFQIKHKLDWWIFGFSEGFWGTIYEWNIQQNYRRFPIENDQEITIFDKNIKKWPLEVKQSPQSRVMSVLLFFRIWDWISLWTDGFLKSLNLSFFFKKQEKVKMPSITKTN